MIGEFTTVDFFMARNADGYTVIQIERKFWIFCQFFYVVGVNVAAFFTALLAGVMIALKDCLAPLLEFAFEFPAGSVGSLSTFPDRRGFAGAPRYNTLFGAEFGALVFGVKRLAANLTILYKWLAPVRPTFFGAIFGRSIGDGLETLSAGLASVILAPSSAFSPDFGIAPDGAIKLFFGIRMKLFATDLAGIYLSEAHACHGDIITQFYKYCAVTLERLAKMGLEPVRIS